MISLNSKFEYGMDPLELVPELNNIFFEIQSIFEKRKINKSEAVLVLSQCIGSISAEIILEIKKQPLVDTMSGGDRMNIIVSSIAKKVGVICPKETKEMDPDESCRTCIHFQFCFDAVMLAMGVMP